MKPKTIGIIGGAGPIAGSYLLERVLSLSRSVYGCYKDADFPQINLISFPFSEMLSPEMDPAQLRLELGQCLDQLRKNGAAIVVIACNTLHAFIDQIDNRIDLIHLPQVVRDEIPSSEIPLVLCTSTSVRFGVHKKWFSCEYPDQRTQLQIDAIIDKILKGVDLPLIVQELSQILQMQSARVIILGCTELSLLMKDLLPCNKLILDPLEIAAKKIVKTSFSNQGDKK